MVEVVFPEMGLLIDSSPADSFPRQLNRCKRTFVSLNVRKKVQTFLELNFALCEEFTYFGRLYHFNPSNKPMQST